MPYDRSTDRYYRNEHRTKKNTHRILDGKSRTCILRSHIVVVVSKTKKMFRSASKTTKFVSNKFQCHCRCRPTILFVAQQIKNKNSRCEVNRKPRRMTKTTATWNAITGHMHLRNKFKNQPKGIYLYTTMKRTQAWHPDSTKSKPSAVRSEVWKEYFTFFRAFRLCASGELCSFNARLVCLIKF